MKTRIDVSQYGSLLVFKKGYSPSFVLETLKSENLIGLRIFAHLKEDRLSNVDFLSDYSFLEALDITSLDDYDFKFLSDLPKLKRLSIFVEGSSEINLAAQVDLNYLAIQWRKGKIKGLEHCQKLETLCLVEYKESDFLPINVLRQVRSLQVKTASVKTLNGIKDLEFLQSLLLGYCPSLRSIRPLNGLRDLGSLEINLCTNIHDYENLTDLPNLKSLTIIDCKSIDSIGFIKNLPSLEKVALIGNTKVLDGDLTPLQGLKEYFFSPYPHYNMKMDYTNTRQE